MKKLKNIDIWISPEIINWDWRIDSANALNPALVRSALEIWNHAQEILDSNPSSHYLNDSIISLNRAVKNRIEILNKIYNLKRFPTKDKFEGTINALEKLGFIRTPMLIKIHDLRNIIEHRYEKPPSIDRCKELSDFVWYFLKSTDNLILSQKTCFYRNPINKEQYGLNIDFDPEDNWKFKAYGWMPADVVSKNENPDWIKLCATNFRTGKDYKNNKKSVKMKNDDVVIIAHSEKENYKIENILKKLLKLI